MGPLLNTARGAFRPVAVAATTAYGIYQAKQSEPAAQEIHQRTAGFDPDSHNLNERMQARMAPHISEDTTASALQGYQQRFNPDKLAMPNFKSLEKVLTTYEYLNTATDAEMRTDVVKAGTSAVLAKVEKISELPAAAMKAGDMAVKTIAGELRGEEAATRETLEALKKSKQAEFAKQTAIGLGIAGIAAQAYPPARVAITVVTAAQTLGRAGYEINALSDLVSKDKGAVLQTMEQRVALNKSPKAPRPEPEK